MVRKTHKVSRRSLLIGSGASALALASHTSAGVQGGSTPHIAVVGAGVFGGWTALSLLRSGARVTLVDAWGPGNSRASSGGESRVIRAGYGADRVYVEMVARSLELWRENQAAWGRTLFHEVGVLWLLGDDDSDVTASLPAIKELGLRYEELDLAASKTRFPQINHEGVRWAFVEKDAGSLLARRGCQAVLEAFVREGGTFRLASARAPISGTGSLDELDLTAGSPVRADAYVFACGPWLPELFPEVLGNLIGPTRQEIYYFGTPAGDDRYTDAKMPAWIAPPTNEDRLYYGIPGNEARGFKIADDTRGPAFDPTSGDRRPTAAGIERAREYVAFRFPGLAGAPLVEARVCQYEESRDGHFILDKHPGLDNVWIVGGGSGHGYKHGPALGERVAQMVLGEKPIDPFFALKRFGGP